MSARLAVGERAYYGVAPEVVWSGWLIRLLCNSLMFHGFKSLCHIPTHHAYVLPSETDPLCSQLSDSLSEADWFATLALCAALVAYVVECGYLR